MWCRRSALCLFGMARIGKALDNPRQPTRPRRYPCNNAQEILAEFLEAQGDPAKNGADMRALFERTVLAANKDRLRAAQGGLAASRVKAGTPKIVNMENVRERLRRVLASCPPDVKLTLAARNEDELSDADVLGMLQDLEELGIVAPGDENGS
jgi:hypothetical protein